MRRVGAGIPSRGIEKGPARAMQRDLRPRRATMRWCRAPSRCSANSPVARGGKYTPPHPAPPLPIVDLRFPATARSEARRSWRAAMLLARTPCVSPRRRGVWPCAATTVCATYPQEPAASSAIARGRFSSRSSTAQTAAHCSTDFQSTSRSFPRSSRSLKSLCRDARRLQHEKVFPGCYRDGQARRSGRTLYDQGLECSLSDL